MFSTPWLSRLAALLLLVAVAAAIYIWVVEPLRIAYADSAAAIVEARELLARFDARTANRAALEAAVAAAEKPPDLGAFYLSGETDTLAAADLQGRLTSQLTGVGATIGSMQTLPSREVSGLNRVTVRVEMSATMMVLARAVHGLETGTPLLFLDNMQIASRLRLSQQQTVYEEPSLTVVVDVYGYLAPRAP